MDYDFIPQAYKQFGEMDEPEEDEDETTKRGVLDRVLSPLMNTSVTSALYNITDDDPDTTFLGGIGAGLSRQLNPFKDDVSDTHTTADVLDNIFGEADGFAGKVVRGVGGFVGDVVLDPMSYTSGAVSAVGKVLRGTGKFTTAAKQVDKIESASKLFKEGVHGRTEATLNDCIEIVKQKYNKIPNAETELQHIIEAEAKTLYENFNKKVAKVVTDEAMNGEGIGIGVANLPFASKLKQGDKMNSIFHRQLVTDRQLREFGDKTISPYYNALSDTIRQTKIMQALSTNNRLFAESQIDLLGTIKKYSAMQNMAKKSTVKATGVYKASEGLSAYRDLPEELQRKFDELYANGELDGFIAYFDMQAKIKKNPVTQDVAHQFESSAKMSYEEAMQSKKFCESLKQAIEEKKKHILTPEGTKATKRHGVTLLSEIPDDFDINNIRLDETMANDDKFTSMLRGLKTESELLLDENSQLAKDASNALESFKDDIDLTERDIVDFYSKHYDHKFYESMEAENPKLSAAVRNELEDLYRIAVEAEYERSFENILKGKEYKKLKKRNNELVAKRDAGTITREEIREWHKNHKLIKKHEVTLQGAKDFREKQLDKFDSLSAEQIFEEVRMSFNDMPERYDELVKRLGQGHYKDITGTNVDIIEGVEKSANNVEDIFDEGIGAKTDRLDDVSTASLRNVLNDLFGSGDSHNGAISTLYRHDEKVGYKFDSYLKPFDKNNFDNRTAYMVRNLLLTGKVDEANELLQDIAASVDFKLTFKRMDNRIQKIPLTEELKKKTGKENIRIVSPSVLRYDKIHIPIYGEASTVTHTLPVYKGGWSEIRDIIEQGKIDEIKIKDGSGLDAYGKPIENILDKEAANGMSHRANIMRLGAYMDPDYVPNGVKPMSDGSLPSSVSRDNDFVFQNIDFLVRFDKEFDTIFDDIQSKRTGKKPDSFTNYSESSMERASKQMEAREQLGKPEYANTVTVVNKSPGTVYGSGAVNYEKSLDTVYGEETATFLKHNKDYILSVKPRYMEAVEAEIESLDEQIQKYNRESDITKRDRLLNQLNTIKNLDEGDIEGLADTPFVDSIVSIYNAFNQESAFGIIGKFAPEEVKKLTNLDDILHYYIEKLGFKLDENATSSDSVNRVLKLMKEPEKVDVTSSQQALSDTKFYPNTETIYKKPRHFKAVDKDATYAEDDIRKLNVRTTIGASNNYQRYKHPAIGHRTNISPDTYVEHYGNHSVVHDNGVISHSKDKPVAIDKELLLKEKAREKKAILAEKGYKDARFDQTIIERLLPDDVMHVIRAAENANESAFIEKVRKMTDGERANLLANGAPDEIEAYKKVMFRDSLFDDATWFAAKKDPEVAKYCVDRLNAAHESLAESIGALSKYTTDGSVTTDNIGDVIGELANYKNLNNSVKAWDDIIEVINNVSKEDDVITAFSGITKPKEQIIKELDAMNKVTPHNYVEMMADLIPRTVTEEAQKYLRTLGSVDKNPTYGITPKMSIAEANKIMKERTGVEKWYNDSIAEAFTGFMVESGKDIHQSGTVNQILRSFGKKFNLEDNIPEGETIVVKAGALKSYISKGQSAKSGKKVINADLSELSKYGLNPDEVQYSTMFVELDKDAYKSILKDYGTGENYLNAYTMSKDNAKLFNDAAHYQNVESESAFWSMYDKFLTVFKTVNTVPNPGFHINNAVGNAFNSFLCCGAAALNPHKINIARTIIKNPDPKQYININGTKISYADMHDMFRKCGVTGGYFEAEAAKEIREHWRTLPIIKQGLRVGTEIEEVQRGALFIEAMMNGNTPSEAMDVVNEFLFDYADLTPQEVKVMKRAIPFYTFMRKNVPLQLREMMLQPELYRNLTKGLNNFERLSGEDYVRDENRSEWRQEYVQVPFKFKGQTFGFDPNLPYEQLDRLTPNKLLGQMTPAIKAPIELASREYAYTGMPVGSLKEYITNQFSIPRAVAVTETKYGADKTLYPMGQLTGMPMGTIRDLGDF